MKKNIYNLVLILFLGASLFSCDDYDPEVVYHDSVLLDLSTSTFTVLDSELPVTIDFVSESKVVTNVNIVADDVIIFEGTATDNNISVTLNRSDLGLNAIDDEQTIYVNATVDGKVKEMWTSIDMVSASSIKDPFYMDVDEDGDDIEVADKLYELSDVVKNFTYKVSPKTATVGNVTAAVKVGEDGTYTNLWTKAYDSDDLNIGIKGSDYEKGDEIFVRLIATVGNFKDTVSSSIVISEYTIGGTSNVEVNAGKSGFDLIEEKEIAVDDETCMLEFTNDFAQLYQGIRVLNGTELVKIADEDLMMETNMPLLKSAFNAGTPITEVENVSVGEKYLIKTTRDMKEYYGTIQITSVNENRTEGDDFVAFDFVVEEYNVQK